MIKGENKKKISKFEGIIMRKRKKIRKEQRKETVADIREGRVMIKLKDGENKDV